MSLGDIGISTINGGGIGVKNAIINGNFAVNQRGVSGTVTLAAGAYGHDRFKAGASGCTYTFATSNNVTTLTISAGSLIQVIEGNNLFDGTYTLSWTGTAQGKIGAGSFSASGVTGSVTGGTNLNIEFNTGTLSLVQLEAGSTATPFERRPFGTELALCQRYLNVLRGVSSTQLPVCPGFMRSTTNFVGVFKLPVTMRTAPSLTSSNSTNHFHISPGNGDFDGPTVGLEAGTYVSPDVIALTMNATTGSSTIGTGASLYINATTSAFLFFVAEL